VIRLFRMAAATLALFTPVRAQSDFPTRTLPAQGARSSPLWLADGGTVDGGGHEGAKSMLTSNHTNPRTSANTSVCATHHRMPNREV
jgi:hypothetical protein